jgi:hypothetical protein
MRKILTYLLFIAGTSASAQADNEIQVYSSPTVGDRLTIFELHNNYTFKGNKFLADPKMAHYLNETLEITHGFGDHFEVGVYFFNTINPYGKYEYLGNHIRPRFTAPVSWNLPVGASLSVEFGFFRSGTDHPFQWEGEIRPILDKTLNKWYFSFNPNIAFVLTGMNKHWDIGPQVKTVYTIKERVGIGIEYYSNLGSFRKIDPINAEEHLLGPAIDLYLSPEWEFNTSFLFGLTPSSNQQIIKLILGHRAGKY